MGYYLKKPNNKKELQLQLFFILKYMFRNQFPDFVKGNPFLFHGIAVTDGNCVVFFGLMVNSYTERRTNGILSSVTFANRIFFFIKTTEMLFAFIH